MTLRLAACILALACAEQPAPAARGATDTVPTVSTVSSSDSPPPRDATARCKDGSYSTSRTKRGTCSGHGGVSTWYITGICNDGTVTKARTSQGACSGHGGVKEWLV